MYTLAPLQLLPLYNPIRCNIQCKLQGSQGGHNLRVLSLRHKLGSPPRRGHFLRRPNHPYQFRGPSKLFCSGKRKHRQRPPTTSATGSLLRLLGYSFLSLLPPTHLTRHVGICRGPCHPSKCHTWGCRPQGAVVYCPSILRGHILFIPYAVTQPDFIFSRVH
jgi:hypothetical protein